MGQTNTLKANTGRYDKRSRLIVHFSRNVCTEILYYFDHIGMWPIRGYPIAYLEITHSFAYRNYDTNIAIAQR